MLMPMLMSVVLLATVILPNLVIGLMWSRDSIELMLVAIEQLFLLLILHLHRLLEVV